MENVNFDFHICLLSPCFCSRLFHTGRCFELLCAQRGGWRISSQHTHRQKTKLVMLRLYLKKKKGKKQCRIFVLFSAGKVWKWKWRSRPSTQTSSHSQSLVFSQDVSTYWWYRVTNYQVTLLSQRTSVPSTVWCVA